jgi:flagellar hook assembly protein FlgD
MHSFEVAVSNGKSHAASVHFLIPQSVDSLQVKIFDMKGSIVREFKVHSLGAGKITWDGMSSSGRMLSAGEYAIKVRAGSYEQAGRIIIG